MRIRQRNLVKLYVWVVVAALWYGTTEAGVFRVSDYGARPNTGTDQLAKVAAALTAASSVPDSTLVFDLVGEYLERTIDRALQVKTGAVGLTIDGRGSSVIMTTWSNAIRSSAAPNLTLKRLSIDYDPVPNVGGMAVGLDPLKKWFDLAVDTSAYDYQSALGKNVSAYIGYVPNGRHFNGSVDRYPPTPPTTYESPESYSGITSLPVLRIADYASGLIVRQYLWVRLSPVCTHTLVITPNGQTQPVGVTVEDVTIYSSPCMGLVMYGVDLTLRRYNVLKKGSRYGSANVDCIHLTGLRGRFLFEDCLLEGSGDDGLNINNQNSEIVEIINSSTIAMAANQQRIRYTGPSYGLYLPGDILSFSHPQTAFKSFAHATISSVSVHPTNTTVMLTDPLPAGVGLMDIVSNDEIASALIRNVTVRNNRARGFLIKNKNTLIEDCKLQNHTLAAMQIATDCGFWWEGRPPYNITVRRTHIHGPYQSRKDLPDDPTRAWAAILMMVESVPAGMPHAPPGGVTDVLFEDNLFEDLPVSAFYIGSSLNVTLRRNIIDGIDLTPLIYCNSANVSVYNNQLIHYAYNSSLLDPTCDASLTTNINETDAWDGFGSSSSSLLLPLIGLILSLTF